MASDLPWKLTQNMLDHAMKQGEEIAVAYSLVQPIDPLAVAEMEECIHCEGDDFGDAFDGRLEHVGSGRFMLAYNTKYNDWPHAGAHHPKIRFTIAHELGHYFREGHRSILRNGGPAYACVTEFQADPRMEREADCFAAGLLMPSSMLAPTVNGEPEPSLADIKRAAAAFDVSMTSMMIRWVRLSDFPCAVFSITLSGIRWGWVSEAFAQHGMFRKHSGPIRSGDARAFLGGGLSQYREGKGLGMLSQWVETDHEVSVSEHYAAIPYAQHALCLLTASEDEMPSDRDE